MGNSILSGFIADSRSIHLHLCFPLDGVSTLWAIKVVKAMVTKEKNHAALPNSSNCFARIY